MHSSAVYVSRRASLSRALRPACFIIRARGHGIGPSRRNMKTHKRICKYAPSRNVFTDPRSSGSGASASASRVLITLDYSSETSSELKRTVLINGTLLKQVSPRGVWLTVKTARLCTFGCPVSRNYFACRTKGEASRPINEELYFSVSCDRGRVYLMHSAGWISPETSIAMEFVVNSLETFPGNCK